VFTFIFLIFVKGVTIEPDICNQYKETRTYETNLMHFIWEVT